MIKKVLPHVPFYAVGQQMAVVSLAEPEQGFEKEHYNKDCG